MHSISSSDKGRWVARALTQQNRHIRIKLIHETTIVFRRYFFQSIRETTQGNVAHILIGVRSFIFDWLRSQKCNPGAVLSKNFSDLRLASDISFENIFAKW